MVRVKAKIGEKFSESPKISIGWSWQILVTNSVNYKSRDSASRALRKFKTKYGIKSKNIENSIFIHQGGKDGEI